MAKFGSREDEAVYRTLIEWRDAAVYHVQDIAGWRTAPEQRGRSPGTAWPRPPQSYFTLTAEMCLRLRKLVPPADPTPLEEVCEWIKLWHDQHSARHLPDQELMDARLDRALLLLAQVESQILGRLIPSAAELAVTSRRPGGRVRANAAASPTDEESPAHAPDFSSVVCHGEVFQFTRLQAVCVGALWEEWQTSGLGLNSETLAERSGSSADTFRLVKVFRQGGRAHPALGFMIHKTGKGSFALGPPRNRRSRPTE